MLRVVIDTNLLVSYALTAGETISRLIDHWEGGTFHCLTSPSLMAELQDVLARPRLRNRFVVDPSGLLILLQVAAEQTAGELTVTISRDPKDNIFLACAVEGRADYIVTGDRDLLDIVEYQGIQIVRVYDLVTLLDNYVKENMTGPQTPE